MDENEKRLVKFLDATTEEDQKRLDESNRMKNMQIERLRRGLMSPSEQRHEDNEFQGMLKSPLPQRFAQKPEVLSPDETALLDLKAQEARKKFDALGQQSPKPLQYPEGLLNNRFDGIKKLIKR